VRDWNGQRNNTNPWQPLVTTTKRALAAHGQPLRGERETCCLKAPEVIKFEVIKENFPQSRFARGSKIKTRKAKLLILVQRSR
jgi:hypothetical protein